MVALVLARVPQRAAPAAGVRLTETVAVRPAQNYPLSFNGWLSLRPLPFGQG